MTGFNIEKELVKLDPNGPDYQIFVKALNNFDGLTTERLKMFVELRSGLHGPLSVFCHRKMTKADCVKAT